MTDKQELAGSAKELLEDPAFQQAVLKLRKQWFAEMLALEPSMGSGYTLTVALACARLKALEAIPAELQVIVNDYKMEQKRK